MEWSGQQGQAPQHASQPGVGPEPVRQYPGINPLQTQVPVSNVAAPGTLPVQPVGVSPVPLNISGIPPMAQPMASVELDDNVSDANDTEWVTRAKRAIGGTRGDPHRQVQLIQHLRSQYLKQRFGRTVQTDKA